MPVRLSDFRNKYKSLRVKWQDLEVNVTYDPAELTIENSLAMQRIDEGSEERILASIEYLQRALVGWDIMQPSENGDEPTPEPITLELMLKLPSAFINTLSDQILENERPPSRKSGR